MPRRSPSTDKSSFQLSFGKVILIVGAALLIAAGSLSFIKMRASSLAPQNPKALPSAVQAKIDSGNVDQITNPEWKLILTPAQYVVLREAGTETPFTGELLHEKRPGTYVTADCNVPVFRSEQKYDSGTGWPSFWAPIKDGVLELREDNSLGAQRTEVIEKKCQSHLGHVFTDGPPPTGQRFCMNSVALKFIPD